MTLTSISSHSFQQAAQMRREDPLLVGPGEADAVGGRRIAGLAAAGAGEGHASGSPNS